MHRSKRNPITAVIFAALFFTLVTVMPIYCNRENEEEQLAAQFAAAAELMRSRDEAAAGDLVDTDAVAEREGYADRDAAPEIPQAIEAEEEFVPDRARMLVRYPKVTPRPSTAMIHSTAYDELETHGDFEGMESALSSLSSTLEGFDGKISVIAYTLDGSRSLTYNSDYRYGSQCTIKAGFVYSICQYMDANAFDDGTLIGYSKDDLVEGSGTVQNNPVGTQFTVRDLIGRTLRISDNTAYNMLLRYFGNTIRNDYMEIIGAETLKTAGLWGNYVSPEDYIVLWDEIYNYFRTGSHYATLMKESCTNTPFAYCNPVNGLDFSHKSGDGPKLHDCHDVCIVWDDEPYILAIFTHANDAKGSHPTMENVAWIIHEKLF